MAARSGLLSYGNKFTNSVRHPIKQVLALSVAHGIEGCLTYADLMFCSDIGHAALGFYSNHRFNCKPCFVIPSTPTIDIIPFAFQSSWEQIPKIVSYHSVNFKIT